MMRVRWTTYVHVLVRDRDATEEYCRYLAIG
jgi:hypothetical protein